MNREELIKRLKGCEWTDIEFKLARTDIPRSAYETVSAFANTTGGWIVFGVQESDGCYIPDGVANPDRIQNDFLSTLRADNKVNHDINPSSKMFEIEGKTLLVFHIPEASRQNKPVYLNGDIRRTFVRRGGCDQRCRMNEIERFLHDSAKDRWDGQVFDFPIDEALDTKSIQWYRRHFHQVNPGHDESQPDQKFLYQWGYILRQDNKFVPTRAAIMLFGSSVAMHHMLPRPTLDVQWIPAKLDDPLPEMRWLDRVVYEDNLITTWQGLVAKYYQNEPRPFGEIDPHTLMRNDTPPGYRVFREAAINLLIHQDYADHSRKAVIKFHKDIIQFWNPGDVFGSDEHLLEPGEKEVRNPRIAAAFRRLALCEQAGTGIQMMRNQWQRLGHPEPKLTNDRSHKAFEFRLGLATAAAPSTDQAGTKLGLSGDQVRVLSNCLQEQNLVEMMAVIDRKNRTKFRNQVLNPMIDAGLIEMTIPDKPRSSKQKYKLTDKGRQVVKSLKQ